MASAKLLMEELRLRAFAYAGRAEEDEAPGRVALAGGRSAASGGALKPAGAIGRDHGRTFEERSGATFSGSTERWGWQGWRTLVKTA